MSKLNFAMYWGASCGGCEIAVLEIHEKILAFADAANVVFWPVAVDFKYKDVEAMPAKHIDLCLWNGAVRTSDNEHVAHLLREKSKVLVAFGACAQLGGIPGLANFTTKAGILKRAYLESQSTVNPEGTLPQITVSTPHGELHLPTFYERVYPLDRIVDVDYYVPGCPPVADQIWGVVEAVLGAQLPEVGSVVGADVKTLCDECPLPKEEKKIKRFYRPYEIVPEPEKCLLEQGLVCAGPATRAGCGARCIKVNMPCRGCYGPPPGIVDQGAKLLSALASVVDSQDEAEIQAILSQIKDPAGTFYRFSLPASRLEHARVPVAAATGE